MDVKKYMLLSATAERMAAEHNIAMYVIEGKYGLQATKELHPEDGDMALVAFYPGGVAPQFFDVRFR